MKLRPRRNPVAPGFATFHHGAPSEVRLTPITLGFGRRRWQRGTPESADQETSARILERLQKLSQPFATTIEIRNGRGIIQIGKGPQ
jgi:poly-gamma-glutamate synthesis protein (capsule biosynthesis protein)